MKKKIIIILIILIVVYLLFGNNQEEKTPLEQAQSNPQTQYSVVPHSAVIKSLQEAYMQTTGASRADISADEADNYKYAEYVLANYPYTKASPINDDNGQELDYNNQTVVFKGKTYRFLDLAKFVDKQHPNGWTKTVPVYNGEWAAISLIPLTDWVMFEKLLVELDDDYDSFYSRWEKMKSKASKPKNLPNRFSSKEKTGKNYGVYANIMLTTGTFQRLERRAELSRKLFK